ncbi:MAG: hypothetical protein OXJ62_11310 [Spirochaetaceae bacterium]|nr:hypothetical protein [Spirochaetaceae bacterium]
MAAHGTMAAGRGGARAGRYAAVLLLTLLLVVACESSVPGIFHTLATENERDNRNLHDDLTVSAVAAVGGVYYVAAHGMWSRPAARDSWQAVARPRPGSAEVPVLGMAQSGGTLCVGTENGVYRAAADPTSPPWHRAVGVSGQIVRVFAIGGREQEILAFATDHEAYEVYLSTDACANFTEVTPGGAAGRPFDAFHDGNRYWLTIGNTVYSGYDLHSLAAEDTPPEAEAAFRGIWCFEGGGRCLFANAIGEVWEHDGNGWELLGQIEPPDDEEETVPLTLFTQIGDQVLVGTRGYGFYQFAEQDLDLDNVRRGPRSTSQLYRAHVTVFARPGNGNLVFAGTAGDGLSSIDIGTAAKDTGTWDWE